MSQANLPNITPSISLSRDDAINLLLSSVALEELGMAHILNTEGEKIQYVLGTLPGLTPAATLPEVLDINNSVIETLQAAAAQDSMTQTLLSRILSIPTIPGPTGPTGSTGPAEGNPGPAGATGPAGAIGAAGATGPEGPSGLGLAGGVTFNPLSAPSYPLGQTVYNGGNTYIANTASPSGVPGVSTDYTLLGAQGAAGPAGPAGPAGEAGPAGPGSTGTAGAPGPAGITGPTGVQGPQAVTGTTQTYAFAANTSGSVITVILGGTSLSLPDAQALNGGITAASNNTVFTVPATGTYYVSYNINTTAALLVGTRLVINGAANASSTISPVVSLTQFSNDVILNLAGGSTISLQLFGLVGTAVLLGGGSGANLTIIRLA